MERISENADQMLANNKGDIRKATQQKSFTGKTGATELQAVPRSRPVVKVEEHVAVLAAHIAFYTATIETVLL